MPQIFKGRVVIPGNLEGEAVVTENGLNILATYQRDALKKAKRVKCADQNNPDLFGQDMTDKIICLPQSIGSTTGGMVLAAVMKLGIGPKAMLFANHIDSLAAAGIIVSDVWVKKRIVTIDQLGEDFLQAVNNGQTIEIKDDGTVIVK